MGVMVTMKKVVEQLNDVGFRNNFWGWSAIRQLPNILNSNEEIERVVTGFYEGGHAVLIATNQRIILLDKKIMSFRVEEVHYEMVSEVEHFVSVFFSKLKIRCLSNVIELSSVSSRQVSDFALYVDGKVNKVRLNMRTWEKMMEDSGKGIPARLFGS